MRKSAVTKRFWIAILTVAVGIFQPVPVLACGWDVFAPNVSAGFYSVESLSPTSVWVVGDRNVSSTVHRSLTEHWDGTIWSVIPSPDTGQKDGFLGSTAITANDMWAVGNANHSGLVRPLIEHWNGTKWSIVGNPIFPKYATLSEVSHVSSSDVWAVGFYQAADLHYRPLVEHWNGSSWSIATTPLVPNVDNYLIDVAVEHPNSVWAVGYTIDSGGHYQTLTQHWNGSAWSIVPSVNGPSDTLLDGAAVSSSNNVWAFGQIVGSDGVLHTLAEHWNGTSWAIVATPDFNHVANLLAFGSSTGNNDVWAVGAYLTPDNFFHALVEHFNGVKWSIVPSPLTSSTINWRIDAKAISSREAYAVGSFTGIDGIMHPFAEHYHC